MGIHDFRPPLSALFRWCANISIRLPGVPGLRLFKMRMMKARALRRGATMHMHPKRWLLDREVITTSRKQRRIPQNRLSRWFEDVMLLYQRVRESGGRLIAGPRARPG